MRIGGVGGVGRLVRWISMTTSAAVAAVLVAAVPAGAHTGLPVHGFADGLVHPFTGADHLLVMIGVGVMATLGRARRSPWVAPAAFVGGMVGGGALGIAGVSLPGVEALVVASVGACGLVIACAALGGRWWMVPTLVIAGMAHGNAHGLEAPHAVQPALYGAGFVVATMLAHAAGLAVGQTMRTRSNVRLVAGAGVAAAGLLLV